MEAMWIGVLGTSGTILSTVSLMPQVLHTWRTRSAADISSAWLVVALVSMLIWTVYGTLIGAPAVALTNILCFFQCAYLLFMKLQTKNAPVTERR